MKRKTIEKTITKKLNTWIETLPEILQKDVKRNVLVSGGCITSMFLKEDINDFDIYIQDRNCLLQLAQHYSVFHRVLDGRNRLDYMQENIKERGIDTSIENYLYLIANDSNKEDLSEFFVRYKTLKEDQLKLDIPSEGILLEHKEEPEKDSFTPMFLSPNAISLSDKIQIVLRFHGTVEQIHSTFDFYHATNYFTFKDGLVTNIKALECILTKELKYQGSLYPLTSIIRMKKFIGRGWTMNAGEVLKMMYQVSMLDLNNIEVLEEQLIGIDVAYFSILINVLRGTREKADGFTYENLSILIDKIFNSIEDED